jgi:preprotein translocase subunit Sss1
MFGIVGEEFFLVQFKNLLKSTLGVDCELSDEKTSDDNNRLKLLFNHKNTIKLFDELYLLTIEFDSEIKIKAQEYKNKYENVIEITNSDLSGEEWRIQKKRNKPTKEKFIEVAKQSKTRKEMANLLNCTDANIYYIEKSYGIKDEITEILKQNNI